MEVWEQINVTLSILAWPVVIGLATLVVFREQVGGLLNRITKGKVGGAEIVLAEAAAKAVTAEANQEFREITESDTATGFDTADREVTVEPSDGAEPGDADQPREPRFTREQVEKFMKIAAETGYKVADLGLYRGEIEPDVHWTGDGIPQITLWEMPDGGRDWSLYYSSSSATEPEFRPSPRARALQRRLAERQRRGEDDSKS